jgi:predicted tellurium resistance membrane protein TerC
MSFAMDWIADPEIWASLLTLTALEIVLGIDNLVFIAILAGRLPAEQQNRARQIGLLLALLTRLALLASIAWIIGLTRPLFDLFSHPVSWRDIVLIAGGLFLLYKGTREIHHMLEGDGPEGEEEHGSWRTSFAGVVTQIMVLDIVFSLDSVITAVGMANTLWVMATAIIIAVVIMLAASRPLAEFVHRHPTVKMLALSFLMLIGMTLIADGAGIHVPKGYIYAAIGFSIGVEGLNQLVARRRRPRDGIRAVPQIRRGGGAANAADGKSVC